MNNADHLKISIIHLNIFSIIPMEISLLKFHQCSSPNPINTSPTLLKINTFLQDPQPTLHRINPFLPLAPNNHTKPSVVTILTLHNDPTQIKTSNVSVVERWDITRKSVKPLHRSHNHQAHVIIAINQDIWHEIVQTPERTPNVNHRETKKGRSKQRVTRRQLPETPSIYLGN
jgi:hypothetical protein